MGKSAKAKKEKKQDFQKAKLKVGKSKAKPDNFTDVSFKARNINVLHQSISSSAPSAASQFSHHLALLNHKSDAQRRDSLAHLTSFLQSQSTPSLPQPAATVLPKVQPLLLDSSAAVRAQCLKFLAALPQRDVQDNAERLLLYARAALTHLSARVRRTGLDALDWLLACAGAQVVCCAGGWTRTLGCLLAVLGWQSAATSRQRDAGADRGWTAVAQGQITGGAGAGGVKSDEDTKATIQQIQVLALLLETGLVDKKRRARREEEAASMSANWPLWQWDQHQVSRRHHPYAYLNLFGEMGAEADDTYPDVDGRLQNFESCALDVRNGMEMAKKEGGGIGRAAMRLEKVLASTYSLDDDKYHAQR